MPLVLKHFVIASTWRKTASRVKDVGRLSALFEVLISTSPPADTLNEVPGPLQMSASRKERFIPALLNIVPDFFERSASAKANNPNIWRQRLIYEAYQAVLAFLHRFLFTGTEFVESAFEKNNWYPSHKRRLLHLGYFEDAEVAFEALADLPELRSALQSIACLPLPHQAFQKLKDHYATPNMSLHAEPQSLADVLGLNVDTGMQLSLADAVIAWMKSISKSRQSASLIITTRPNVQSLWLLHLPRPKRVPLMSSEQLFKDLNSIVVSEEFLLPDHQRHAWQRDWQSKSHAERESYIASHYRGGSGSLPAFSEGGVHAEAGLVVKLHSDSRLMVIAIDSPFLFYHWQLTGSNSVGRS